jgi:hypothetical protein
MIVFNIAFVFFVVLAIVLIFLAINRDNTVLAIFAVASAFLAAALAYLIFFSCPLAPRTTALPDEPPAPVVMTTPEVKLPVETVEIPATAIPIPFTGLVINDCPSASLGTHPDSGQPLIFKMYPYVNADGTGDTNVLCEFEVLDLTQEVKIQFSGTNVAIVADWSHGTYLANGEIKEACPTGWKCEGVWTATDDFIIPAGTLVHAYVYIRETPAKERFTQFNQWWAAFPCEYIATQGHSMWNIRVPAWAQAQGEVGTIYGFGLPVGYPARLTCPGFPIDWEPLPGQLTTQ